MCSPDCARELAEGRQAGAPQGPGDPLEKPPARDVDLPSVEDPRERLLEQVGPVERAVGLLQDRELVLLVDGEVPGVLLQRVARPFDRSSLVGVLALSDLLLRTSSSASCASLCTWKRSKMIRAWGEASVTALM